MNTIYHCQDCLTPFEAPQGSRIRFCSNCQAKRKIQGQKRSPNKPGRPKRRPVKKEAGG